MILVVCFGLLGVGIYWAIKTDPEAAAASVDPTIKVCEIPAVFAALKGSTGEVAFAVFVFNSPDGSTNEDALNIQFSIEDGIVGFDWCLVTRPNIDDAGKFVAYSERRGYTVEEKEMNGVQYHRVETGDLASLCGGVATDMYGLSTMDRLTLIAEGFRFDPTSGQSTDAA